MLSRLNSVFGGIKMSLPVFVQCFPYIDMSTSKGAVSSQRQGKQLGSREILHIQSFNFLVSFTYSTNGTSVHNLQSMKFSSRTFYLFWYRGWLCGEFSQRQRRSIHLMNLPSLSTSFILCFWLRFYSNSAEVTQCHILPFFSNCRTGHCFQRRKFSICICVICVRIGSTGRVNGPLRNPSSALIVPTSLWSPKCLFTSSLRGLSIVRW